MGRAANFDALDYFRAPEGIAKVQQTFSDVVIFTCVIDRCLNEQIYHTRPW